MFEKPYFAFYSSTISHKFPRCTDHTMTRYDDDDIIMMIGSSDGSYRFVMSYHRSLFEITSSFTIRDNLQTCPGFFLELGSIYGERNIKYFPCSSKIFSELHFYLINNWIYTELCFSIVQFFYFFYLFF